MPGFVRSAARSFTRQALSAYRRLAGHPLQRLNVFNDLTSLRTRLRLGSRSGAEPYFIKRTDRLRLISRVILRCKWAGIPVMRRGRILPLSVTNFFKRSGFL